MVGFRRLRDLVWRSVFCDVLLWGCFVKVLNKYGVVYAAPQVQAQGLAVRKNSTGTVSARKRVNLIEGSNVTLTVADDDASDEVDVTIAASSGSGSVQYCFQPQGRLARASGTPVNISSSASTTTLYYTPYGGNCITLWDGSAWTTVTFTELSMSLSGLTSGICYDVFGYLSSGALALEKLAWTNAISRATAVTLQDGRYCKSGDKTRLYLGTFYALSTTQTADSWNATGGTGEGRLIWNMYNRIPQRLFFQESADSWIYTTGSHRPWPNNNSGSARCNFVVGLQIEPITMDFVAITNGASGASCGIGLNSTTTNSALLIGASATSHVLRAVYHDAYSTLGFNYLAPLEYGVSGCSFYGDNGINTRTQAGWFATVWG